MNLQSIAWKSLDAGARSAALQRPAQDNTSLRQSVAEILARVRNGGDAAVLALTQELDGCKPQPLIQGPAELEAARARCAPDLLAAMEAAAANIRKLHDADVPRALRLETTPGVRCEVRHQAIDPVGLYVPAGSAPLVSTALMLGIPAQLAGCQEIILCTPPGRDGTIAAEILAAASLCGVTRVCAVGGAQAVAAMAFGTESIPRCAKIFGPGNAWVTEAKQQVSLDPNGAAIDLPAGPSEVLVIADDSANPDSLAWDLLSQAEHGPDSQVILLSDSEAVAQATIEAVQRLTADLPRKEIVKIALSAARFIVADNLDEALQISNAYAPEHLIINTRNARELADQARNAGSIFIGAWTPESLGDYCSGTNHVLPTYGWARSHGALSVADFMRRYTLQEASLAGLQAIGPTAETLALFEGLDAHRMAVRQRLDEAR